jgi:hypothetical protein
MKLGLRRGIWVPRACVLPLVFVALILVVVTKCAGH